MNTIDLYRKQLLKALKRKDVESFENLEDYENLRMRGGFGLPQFKTAQSPQQAAIPGNPPAQSYVAQYDFKIFYSVHGDTRITDILPVPLFMPIHEISLYNGVDMPVGVILANSTIDNIYEFTFIKGENYSTLKILGLTSSWGVLMKSILTGEEYELTKIRLTAPSGHEDKFFSTYIKLFGRTSLGKTYLNDTVPFLSQKSPLQYDKTILDIDIRFTIQKDNGLIYGMPAPAVLSINIPITFSLFISKLVRK
jgi:hypothetical protein